MAHPDEIRSADVLRTYKQTEIQFYTGMNKVDLPVPRPTYQHALCFMTEWRYYSVWD